jgi:hypothetical protein
MTSCHKPPSPNLATTQQNGTSKPPTTSTSLDFFRSLFRSYPYTTHKFYEFNPKQKFYYVTFAHSLEHGYYCQESRCRFHDAYQGRRYRDRDL